MSLILSKNVNYTCYLLYLHINVNIFWAATPYKMTYRTITQEFSPFPLPLSPLPPPASHWAPRGSLLD